MNFLLLILLDISASADGSPEVIIARKPLEALVADWLRQGEEIHRLQSLVTQQTGVSHRQSLHSLRPDSLSHKDRALRFGAAQSRYTHISLKGQYS